VQQLWDAVDADGNGSLDKAELGDLRGMLGRPPSDIDRLMAEIDTDDDGEVDKAEFGEWFQTQQVGDKLAQIRLRRGTEALAALEAQQVQTACLGVNLLLENIT
jgi:hypothetical protein